MKLLLPLMLFLPSLASAACPTNGASGYGPGGYYEYQHTGPTWNEGIYAGHVSYDLMVGTFGVASGGGGGEHTAGVGLGFSDIYQIVGPASAIPVPFQVVVHLSGNLSAGLQSYPYIGTVCDAASTNASVTSGPVSDSFSQGSYSPECTSVVVDHDMSLALQKLPAEAFTVGVSIGVGGSNGGSVNGTIAFVGLPPGYSVTSCQGYNSAPTPAAHRTWGELKHLYR